MRPVTSSGAENCHPPPAKFRSTNETLHRIFISARPGSHSKRSQRILHHAPQNTWSMMKNPKSTFPTLPSKNPTLRSKP
jgi:hypothetical protein